MNLNENAPLEFLRGFMNIHPPYVSFSARGGPQIENGYRLGELQIYRLKIALERRDENGKEVEKKVRTRSKVILKFGYKRMEARRVHT